MKRIAKAVQAWNWRNWYSCPKCKSKKSTVHSHGKTHCFACGKTWPEKKQKLTWEEKKKILTDLDPWGEDK